MIDFWTEGTGGRKWGRERSMCACLLCAPYWGPGLQHRHVPWLELNWWPFGSQACALSTEPHQPGLDHLFFKDVIYYLFFRERGREEKDRERNIEVREIHQLVASCTCPYQGTTRNPGLCPNQKSNWWPFSLWDNGQPSGPHWSGPDHLFKKKCI